MLRLTVICNHALKSLMAPARDESVLSQSAIKITPACHELLKDNRVQSLPFFDILQPFN